ncbi:MAG: flagellar biosynthesis anti-sigma factor FlgM [Candidatus Geothermincolales bacterium]
MQISRDEARRIIRRLPEIGGEVRDDAVPPIRELFGENGPKILEILNDLPEVRVDKVLRLRTAIMERRYQVPAEKVAEKMIFRALADRIA